MNGLKYAVIMMLFVFTGVLASWRDARALPFSFQINRFQINQDGVDLVNDSFDDGLEPPLGPGDTAACLPNSCIYRAIGTFGANDETGGSLTLNHIGAQNFVIGSGIPVQRKGARRRQNINQSGGAFFIEGDFVGILPTNTAGLGHRESYRIQLIDSGSGGTRNDSIALRVQNFGGSPQILFRDVSNSINLGSFTLPGALSPEITLRLDVDASGEVTASYDLDGRGTNGAMFTQFENKAQIYDGETFTRARFLAQSPIPEPSTLFLLGFGLVGLGLFRRRRESA